MFGLRRVYVGSEDIEKCVMDIKLSVKQYLDRV
jgi:hypothetical protein